MRILFSTIFCLITTLSLAQTQSEMNAASLKDYEKADKELNAVYQKILKEYSTDSTFIKNLKATQRIWVQFRDAETKAMYPDREAGYYGTIHPVCLYSYMKDLTEERIERLKVWLTGLKEGDACSGSIKTKD